MVAMWSAVVSLMWRATLVDWLFLVGVVLAVLYYVGTSTYDFFERHRGLPAIKPKLPFAGSFMPMFLGTEPLTDTVKRLYDAGAGHSVVGLFDFRTPLFMIRDPELLKQVAVKEFDSFVNHRKPQTDDLDPVLLKNLFSLRDQRWREMRATLSPAFTSSKLKGMFELISTCSRQLVEHIRQEHGKGGTATVELDVKDLYTRIANDLIATIAFGISVDSFKHPDNEFYRMGKETTTPSAFQILTFFGYMIFPKLMKALNIRLLSTKALSFFDSLVHETIRERQKKSIVRPDMLQLLMQAREGSLKADAEEHQNVQAPKIKLDDDDITAQAIIFFFAGFDTFSTALCFTTYALATHPDVQESLYREVEEVMRETGGELTYEVVQGMKYLDMVLSEALRLYPPGVLTDRQCSADCTLGGEGGQPPVRFVSGDKLWIPVCGFHRDPQYWDDPDKFDPQRFSEENKHKIKPFTYMPFGMGPRICIGQRFALLEMKVSLIHLLANFELSRKDGNDGTIKYAKGMRLMPASGHNTFFKPRI